MTGLCVLFVSKKKVYSYSRKPFITNMIPTRFEHGTNRLERSRQIFSFFTHCFSLNE